MMVLLMDETVQDVSRDDAQERESLVDFFDRLPIEFFSKMRHLQPQVGCLNACTVCSRASGTICEYWNKNQLRNVIAALAFCAKKHHSAKPFLAWDRAARKAGTVFAYLDNDIGSYPYIGEFVKLVSRELGVKLKISTVGFSRHNPWLIQAHKEVASNADALASLRLSFTPYACGWNDNDAFSRQEYMEDCATFLRIYRSLFDALAERAIPNFHIAIRFPVFSESHSADVFEQDGRLVISCGNYMLISAIPCKALELCTVNMEMADLTNASINLKQALLMKKMKVYSDERLISGEGIPFVKYIIADSLRSVVSPRQLAETIVKKQTVVGVTSLSLSKVYKFENLEGEYYAIDPLLGENGYYGMQIYPKTEKREKSGFVVAERFFFNAISKIKKDVNLYAFENEYAWNYEHTERVLLFLREMASYYRSIGFKAMFDHIDKSVFPIVQMLRDAIVQAEYPFSAFFDCDFMCDTGLVSNIGRAYKEYSYVTSLENEPITPFQTRNFGNLSSVKTQEDDVWDLVCARGNKIFAILPPPPTDSREKGENVQSVIFENTIPDVVEKFADLKNAYRVPGQKH